MDILSFLLPTAGLDWVFAVLLISWLAFALFSAAKAKTAIDAHVTASHFKNIKSSVHDLSVASRHPFRDHIVDNAPGFALVIGLLGTFLGIGMAIQGAGSILADLNSNQSSATDIRQTVGQLSPMLSEIGLKFKSSAWGIIVHIILRFSIPLFGIEEKRLNEIFKELEKDHADEEALNTKRWDIIKQLEQHMQASMSDRRAQHTALVDSLSMQNTALLQMMELQKSLNRIQQDQLNTLFDIGNSQSKLLTTNEDLILPSLKASEQHLVTVATVQADFGKNVKTLGTSVKSFQETVDVFKADMHDSLQAMQSSTKQASEGLQGAITTMQKQVDSTFTKFGQGVSSTLAKVGQDIAGSSDAIKESVYTLSDGMIKELQNVTKVSADLTTHSQAMALAIEEQQLVLSEMGDRVEQITANGAKYAFALENLAGADGEMVKNLTKLNQLSESEIVLSKAAVQHLEVIAKNSPVNRQKNNHQKGNQSAQQKGFLQSMMGRNENE